MEQKRLLLPGFIPPELCEELVFIHKSCGVVGYRPRVFSTTLSHLVATNAAALIMPFIALREKVKEAVEEFFGCEFELFVEFTGLISWTPGASIGWHSDDNREYLRQRHYSAVCYLNTYEKDFHGGLFHFQDGQPATVVPTLGTVLIYSANEDNIHSVDEVLDGERITMALWFTRDPAHDEDRKLIDQLVNAVPFLCKEIDDPRMTGLCGENSGNAVQEKEELEGHAVTGERRVRCQSVPSDTVLRDSLVPVPASPNMYWVSETETVRTATNEAVSLGEGFDVRVKRLAALGFDCVGQLDDPDSMLEKPLKLAYHHQPIAYEFANALHALQVVQFHEWRACIAPMPRSSMCHTNLQTVKFRSQKLEGISMTWERKHPQTQQHDDFKETTVKPWSRYVHALFKDLSQILPAWQNTRSLFIRQHQEALSPLQL